jgi:hypothetical protein
MKWRELIAVVLVMAAAFAMLGLVIAAMPVPAHSRDNGQYAQVNPEIKTWVEGLTDSQGRGGCATADGCPVEEVERDIDANSYRIFVEGKWYRVPDGAVIKQRNRLGYAVAWYYFSPASGDNRTLVIRCLLPGNGA